LRRGGRGTYRDGVEPVVIVVVTVAVKVKVVIGGKVVKFNGRQDERRLVATIGAGTDITKAGALRWRAGRVIGDGFSLPLQPQALAHHDLLAAVCNRARHVGDAIANSGMAKEGKRWMEEMGCLTKLASMLL